MIPFSLFQAFFITESEQLEVRALELSPTSFSIRLAPIHQRLLPEVKKIKVRFYSPVKNNNLVFDLSYYTIIHRSCDNDASACVLEHFAEYYQVITQDAQFSDCVKAITAEYLTYVENKIRLLSEELSHTYYPEYPSNQEEDFCNNLDEQRHYWGKGVSDKIRQKKECEFGLHIRYSCEIASFLETTPSTYLKSKFVAYSLESHSLATTKLTHVSFGDACCPMLFPAPKYYEQIITYCLGHKLKLLFQLAPVSDTLLDSICDSLVYLNQLLLDHEFLAEVEVGDMGMFRFCESLKGFSLVSKGVLMCKKKKDSRLSYLPKAKGKELTIHGSDNDSCLLLDETAQNVYLPYYQTNTGTFCPLRALTDHSNRSKQTRITSCSQECNKHHIMYPKHLNMVGIGNSLYGFHMDSLIQGYKDIKKRIILNL